MRRPRRTALPDLSLADLLQQHTNRPRENLPDIPIRHRMAKQRTKLLELIVDLLVRCKADRISLCAERLLSRAKSPAGHNPKGYRFIAR